MDTSSLSASDDPLVLRALAASEQAWRAGRLRRARRLLGDAVARSEARGDIASLLCAWQLLGHIALKAGDVSQAREHHRAVLQRSVQLNFPLGVASALHNLGLVAAAAGDEPTAQTLIADAITRYEAIDHEAGVTAARANLALLARQWVRNLGGPDERR